MKSKLNWLEGVLLIAPFLVLALFWHALPARMPRHWNLSGEIDAWEPKMPGALIAPLVGLGITALLRALPKFDPKLWRTLGREGRMYAVLPIIRIAILALLDAGFFVEIAVSLGWKINATRILLVSTLIFFAVFGNYLGSLRPNYFAGIRTPWTLENPETWRATHRLGGRLLFFGSLLLLALQFILNDHLFNWVFMAALILFAIWGIFYSWYHWRTQIARH